MQDLIGDGPNLLRFAQLLSAIIDTGLILRGDLFGGVRHPFPEYIQPVESAREGLRWPTLPEIGKGRNTDLIGHRDDAGDERGVCLPDVHECCGSVMGSVEAGDRIATLSECLQRGGFLIARSMRFRDICHGCMLPSRSRPVCASQRRKVPDQAYGR